MFVEDVLDFGRRFRGGTANILKIDLTGKSKVSIPSSILRMRLSHLTRRKYRLFKVLELALVHPRPTKIIEIRAAIVSMPGVKIHAIRPAFPMVVKVD